ncbi:MAG: anaerobic ribonucleoside-triphosphate reductase activating protein [Candidatus Bipolaricaulaceae bacterium]
MKLASVQWASLIDFPGRVAAVVWTAGCNFRCPFCYNPELVLPERVADLPTVPLEGFWDGLGKRREFLDGLVITGGEPTLQPDLADFLREVRAGGLAVKLDTNGSRPRVLGQLLAAGLVDYVALDVKAPFPRYQEFTGADEAACRKAWESVDQLRNWEGDYELRTTVAPGLGPDDLAAVAQAVAGARRYVLQPFFVPPGKELIDPLWRSRPHLGREELAQLAPRLGRWVSCRVRG